MTLKGASGATKLLIISDGKTLAKSIQTRGTEPDVKIRALAAGLREHELASEGCGGPWSLLQRLRPQLRNLEVKQGKIGADIVFRVTAEAPGEASGLPVALGVNLQCNLMFDEGTLWLRRIEWRQPGSARELLLEMEFRNPIVNQPLSDEDCSREFSFP